jgi:hypothetical protein
VSELLVREVPIPPVLMRVPGDREALKAQLGALGELATATEWARAAIVWAWVKPGEQGDNRFTVEVNSDHYNARQFARLGFAGLSSHATVMRYHEAWEWAMSKGKAKPTKPGESFMLPSDSWEIATGRIERAEAKAKKIEAEEGDDDDTTYGEVMPEGYASSPDGWAVPTVPDHFILTWFAETHYDTACEVFAAVSSIMKGRGYRV